MTTPTRTTPNDQAPLVILASASPRRRDLLDLIGIAHQVRPADIDEAALPDEAPAPHAERLARAKAHALAEANPHAVVIAADTIVVVDGDILGKPRDEAQAAQMLRRLAGREHTVFTAIAVARDARTESAVEDVRVTFRALSDEEIAAYIATREPMDKAGAYGIQDDYGAVFVTRIEGCSAFRAAIGRAAQIVSAPQTQAITKTPELLGLTTVLRNHSDQHVKDTPADQDESQLDRTDRNQVETQDLASRTGKRNQEHPRQRQSQGRDGEEALVHLDVLRARRAALEAWTDEERERFRSTLLTA